MYLLVLVECICISLYILVFACMCLYVTVLACMYLYLHVSVCIGCKHTCELGRRPLRSGKFGVDQFLQALQRGYGQLPCRVYKTVHQLPPVLPASTDASNMCRLKCSNLKYSEVGTYASCGSSYDSLQAFLNCLKRSFVIRKLATLRIV